MSDPEYEAHRRAVESLHADQDRVRLSLNGWSQVTPDDLRQFKAQAEYEAEVYTGRDRPTLARTFAGLAMLAASELGDRAAGEEPAVWLSLSAPLDETAGAEANKDDLGVFITRALFHYNEAGTRDGTKNLWGRVMADMMTNREHLRSLGKAL